MSFDDQMHEITGPVVSVDDDEFHIDRNPVNPSAPLTLRIPTSQSVSGPNQNGSHNLHPSPLKSPSSRKQGMMTHQIVSGGDEHRVLTTPSGHVVHQQSGLKRRNQHPKFSSIVNEYVGACLEDNCNIGGYNLFSKLNITNLSEKRIYNLQFKTRALVFIFEIPIIPKKTKIMISNLLVIHLIKF